MKRNQQVRKIGLILGPILFILLYFLPVVLISELADNVVAVAAWMICWWITEAVSISVTSLIPLAFFPITGIMDLKPVAANYGHPIVYLFFGGFVMALALEKVNLHKRIALNIIKLTGTSPDKVILGFMLATALLSMWISNTATTVVMLPIALSVIQLLEKETGAADKNFSLSMMLGIAFSANVGGIATVIGTPPNTVLIGFLEKEYDMQISFLKWMMMGIPFTAIMLTVIYLLLVKVIYPNALPNVSGGRAVINSELEKLGTISQAEKRVLTVFGVAIFLWVSRTYINSIFPNLNLSDPGISILAALALFVIPFRFATNTFILEWEDTVRLPWGILILFGGGLALASGFSSAGIIDFIGATVSANESLSPIVVVSILICILLFMTEVMSNVALIAIFAPVVAGIALGLDQSILSFLIPITMASSCAFMLPMATPPNAIVFASGHIKVHEMVKAGVVLNSIAVVLLILFSLYFIPFIFG